MWNIHWAHFTLSKWFIKRKATFKALIPCRIVVVEKNRKKYEFFTAKCAVLFDCKWHCERHGLWIDLISMRTLVRFVAYWNVRLDTVSFARLTTLPYTTDAASEQHFFFFVHTQSQFCWNFFFYSNHFDKICANQMQWCIIAKWRCPSTCAIQMKCHRKPLHKLINQSKSIYAKMQQFILQSLSCIAARAKKKNWTKKKGCILLFARVLCVKHLRYSHSSML